MLDQKIHECPRCESPVPREHFASRKLEHRVDEFLYCEFCGYGVELSRYPDDGVFALDFQEKTEPVNFGKFLQRLELARVA